ncbi:MAG: outer membrane protein assembly factor BamE [Proteobacteria bacterium]|nr:outer membrane protein assembly factor BamE [Pseudomonadota bacterium]
MFKKISLFCLLFLAACSTGTKSIKGSLIKDNEISQLRAGTHSKQQVIQILGTPSSKSTLNDDLWYYITDHTITKPLKRTKVSKRQVLILNFKDNILDKVTNLDESSSKSFRPEEEKTESQGKKLTIFDQIIQNLTSGIK